MEAKNLPLFLGISDKGDEVISTLLKGGLSLEESLVKLSQEFKVRIRFREPVHIQVPRRRETLSENSWRFISCKQTDDHVFSGFFHKGGSLYYLTKTNGRRGYQCDWISKAISFEPVVDRSKKDEFDSYEDFKKKFDPLFISDAQIQGLWNSRSAQHGGKYVPSDFHRLGKRGKEVLARFLQSFKGVPGTEGTPCYRETKYGTHLSERYYSYCHTGRDITIEHRLGNDVVHYSSEYHGCGNGRYGLIVNKNEFLWMEDD